VTGHEGVFDLLSKTRPNSNQELFQPTGSGKVVKIGSAVTRVKEGDSVLLSFNYCSNCGPCKVSVDDVDVDEGLTIKVDDR